MVSKRIVRSIQSAEINPFDQCGLFELLRHVCIAAVPVPGPSRIRPPQQYYMIHADLKRLRQRYLQSRPGQVVRKPPQLRHGDTRHGKGGVRCEHQQPLSVHAQAEHSHRSR
eukprot:3100109-Pleurochrysis_carterae.AAC.5